MASGITKSQLESFKWLSKTLDSFQGQEDGPSQFWTLLYKEMERTECMDDDYLDHTGKWRSLDKAIERVDGMSFSECCTWLTWALSGERFCEGLFADCIKQGWIKALLDRVVNLKD